MAQALPFVASVSVQEADFDVGGEIAALSEGRRDVGAIASFVGLVRDLNDGSGVSAMTLEHYPGMTEKALEEIVEQARQRWSLQGVRVIHRFGRLEPANRIVFVGVASPHRGEAFAACEFIMDYLKTRAPFWKREETPEGARWVDARESDDSAAARWQRGD
ncbi:molybdenum cofactor biosynthesis protein MoaE [Thauera propionica]|uniref:Molybdopterin synthase catalytic subunit n=1 Tax=Thauera propionica TaxID=2019431 RepID=A0A235EZL4_9RHOO|nr:molybdopterin synthase catalytic subunit MoaE [Thauera propionica]OYD54401.1 molybdenum cofactor biosynthesis protein MoaE [Thauera propionica]